MSSSERIAQENIYRNVIGKIESLLSETSSEDYSDSRITMIYQVAQDQLSSIRGILTKELKSLQEHAEWDSFTIAFYGETNAGKSTLIEALRILLHEEIKVKDRAVFDDVYNKLIALKDRYSKIEQTIDRIHEEKDRWTQEITALIDEETNLLESIDNKQQYAVALIEANKLARADLRTYSTRDFFRVLFGIDAYSEKNASLREEIPKLKLEYKERESRLDSYRDSLKNETKGFEQKLKPLEDERTLLEQEIMPLCIAAESHRDGQIIGTGIQDFTQEVTAYSFTIKNHGLILLDLPGIEGKEAQYIDSIVSSLEKAHAVFYISKTPKPPQNGEDKTSMLAKVGNQLSGQTEVYFIYNKSVQKAEDLEKISVISNDIQKSLTEVDVRMKELLGDNYKGHFVISAMPAYLAYSNNYGESVNAKRLKKRQEKLLREFTPEELISNSKIDTIIAWIVKNLTGNYREKIRDANYYKIINCLDKTEWQIATLESKFKELRDTISGELTSSFKAIDARLNSMINELRDAKQAASNQFKFKSNEILYEEIDKGVDDEELSDIIKRVFEAQSRDAIELFNTKLKELGATYAKDVADINNKYQKYFSENIVVFGDTSGLGFEYDPIIAKHPNKNKDAAWIIGDIIGAVLLVSTNSTAVLVLTILGLLISVGRFIVKSIDPESNKAFQRQDLDQNVKNARIELEKTLQDHNETVIVKIEENNQKIKDRMEKSLKELDNTLTALEKAKKGINVIHEEYINEREASS